MGPVKGDWVGPVVQSTTGPVKQVKPDPGQLGLVYKAGPGLNIKLKMSNLQIK